MFHSRFGAGSDDAEGFISLGESISQEVDAMVNQAASLHFEKTSSALEHLGPWIVAAQLLSVFSDPVWRAMASTSVRVHRDDTLGRLAATLQIVSERLAETAGAINQWVARADTNG